MLAVDNTSEEWNSQRNISFVLVSYLFMKIKRAVFTAGEGLFFPPSLCHLMLSPLWKQQIYAWSCTGKNWTLLPVGILPWKAAGSDERFHPDQIREYSTMSLFSQETSKEQEGARSQGSAGCTPGCSRQSVLWREEKRVRLSGFCLHPLKSMSQRERSPVWTQRGRFLHHATMLCLMRIRSRDKTCGNSHLLNKALSDGALPVHSTVLSSLSASCFS